MKLREKLDANVRTLENTLPTELVEYLIDKMERVSIDGERSVEYHGETNGDEATWPRMGLFHSSNLFRLVKAHFETEDLICDTVCRGSEPDFLRISWPELQPTE